MVGVPQYENLDEQIEIIGTIREQGYLDRGWDVYYFRVTEEQYYELTNDYFTAEKLSMENIKKVMFTYDELFGTYTN